MHGATMKIIIKEVIKTFLIILQIVLRL